MGGCRCRTVAVRTYRWQACGDDAGNTDAMSPGKMRGAQCEVACGGDAGKQVATAADHDGAHELHAGATACESLLVRVWGVWQPNLNAQATWSYVSAELRVLCFAEALVMQGSGAVLWLRLQGAAQYRDRRMRPCITWFGGPRPVCDAGNCRERKVLERSHNMLCRSLQVHHHRTPGWEAFDWA